MNRLCSFVLLLLLIVFGTAPVRADEPFSEILLEIDPDRSFLTYNPSPHEPIVPTAPGSLTANLSGQLGAYFYNDTKVIHIEPYFDRSFMLVDRKPTPLVHPASISYLYGESLWAYNLNNAWMTWDRNDGFGCSFGIFEPNTDVCVTDLWIVFDVEWVYESSWLTGLSLTNYYGAALGRYDLNGSSAEITIPLYLEGGRWSGQIVATAVVPEPSTLTISTIGGLALLLFRRRHQHLIARQKSENSGLKYTEEGIGEHSGPIIK